jgi:hypothetical protein
MTTTTGHGTASIHAAQWRTPRVTVVARPGMGRTEVGRTGMTSTGMTRAGIAGAGIAGAGITGAAVARIGMAGACPGLRR